VENQAEKLALAGEVGYGFAGVAAGNEFGEGPRLRGAERRFGVGQEPAPISSQDVAEYDLGVEGADAGSAGVGQHFTDRRHSGGRLFLGQRWA
jgi:hypothetical protein